MTWRGGQRRAAVRSHGDHRQRPFQKGTRAQAELTAVSVPALRFPRARVQSAKPRGREDGGPGAGGLIEKSASERSKGESAFKYVLCLEYFMIYVSEAI